MFSPFFTLQVVLLGLQVSPLHQYPVLDQRAPKAEQDIEWVPGSSPAWGSSSVPGGLVHLPELIILTRICL